MSKDHLGYFPQSYPGGSDIGSQMCLSGGINPDQAEPCHVHHKAFNLTELKNPRTTRIYIPRVECTPNGDRVC